MSEVSRRLCTYMFKVNEGPGTPPTGARKAARLVRQARRRARLSQSDLARRVGVPVQTVNRIEHGRVDPRLGTVERLLTACGWTLVPEARTAVDRTQIRELLVMSPLGRLAWRQRPGWVSRVVRFLQVMASRGTAFVVSGATAERIHGAPVPVGDLQIQTLADGMNARKLARALEIGNARFRRVGVTAVSCSASVFEGLISGAEWIPIPAGGWFPVLALDDLIGAAPPDRVELLRCVREEIDMGP